MPTNIVGLTDLYIVHSDCFLQTVLTKKLDSYMPQKVVAHVNKFIIVGFDLEHAQVPQVATVHCSKKNW